MTYKARIDEETFEHLVARGYTEESLTVIDRMLLEQYGKSPGLPAVDIRADGRLSVRGLRFTGRIANWGKYPNVSILRFISFYDCVFDGVDLWQTGFTGSRFTRCSFRNAEFTEVIAANTEWSECNFTGAIFCPAEFKNAYFYKSRFDHVDMAGAVFDYSLFESCSMNGIDAQDASFYHVEFSDVLPNPKTIPWTSHDFIVQLVWSHVWAYENHETLDENWIARIMATILYHRHLCWSSLADLLTTEERAWIAMRLKPWLRKSKSVYETHGIPTYIMDEILAAPDIFVDNTGGPIYA